MTRAASAVRTVRKSKDHVAGPECLSAGSFFKNCRMDAESSQFREIVARFVARREALLAKGHDWLSLCRTSCRRSPDEIIAGSLIATSSDLDDCPDMFKPLAAFGPLRLGQAGSNTIVNLGTATADDVLRLARQMRAAVEHTYGVTLESEVVPIGNITL